MTIGSARAESISLEDTSVPVVVLGSHIFSCLGIARSLGRLGVPVYCIDPNPWLPALHSRYILGKFIWDLDKAAPETTVRYLLAVAKKIGNRPILIPTYDEGSALVSDYAEVLGESYVFHHVPSQLVHALTSKKEMFFLAKKHNIPTAETLFPQSRDDLDTYLEHVMFPIMLKGIHGNALKLRSGKKNFIIRTKKELLDLYDRYEDHAHPNLMLQEYIPGGDDSVWMFEGYFNERSECLFAITGKKIRQTPPHTGMTSLGVCLKNDTIVDMTKRFMKSIGYKGILDIGYRFDFRDGMYKVLDINPRIGCSSRLFVGDNGLDVARAEYMELTGQHVPSSKIIEGRKWLLEDRDLQSSLQYFREKNLTFAQWTKSLRGVQETCYFASDDLLPAFFMCARALFLSTRSTHIANRLFPRARTTE